MASIDKLGLTEKTEIKQKRPRGENEKSAIPKSNKSTVKTDRGNFKFSG